LALELVALTHRYGRRVALRDVSLHVREGECYGLLGPNGAGKTTLLRRALLLTSGADERRGGHVLVEGFDAQRFPREALARISGTIEVPGFWGALDGREHLVLAARLTGSSLNDARANADRWLERLGVAAAAREPVRRWSQGMRQRLGIALAMACAPRYLLLDEPTNSLDPEGIADLRELLLAEVRERGLGLLVSSHQLAEVEQWCHRVGFLRGGRLILEVERSELERREPTRLNLRTGDDARAALVCEALGMPASDVSAGGLAVLPNGRSASALAAALVHEGIPLEELTPHRPSLEDLYLGVARDAGTEAVPDESQLARGAAAVVEHRSRSPGSPAERLAPSRPILRAFRHEVARACARSRSLVWLLAPCALGVLAVLQSSASARRAVSEMESGEVYSATAGSAFQTVAAGMQAALPLLALILCGAASQLLAGELARGTHRLLLVQPIGRGALVAGKLAAVLSTALVAFVVLAGAVGIAASATGDFGDVIEVLPNGKPYPLVAAAELWPALAGAMPDLLVALLAITCLGFLAGSLARTSAAALSSALGLYVALDLLRAPARIADLEAWLPTTYLPSPLGDRSALAAFADMASGASDATFASSGTALLVPLAWSTLAIAVAFLAWTRRSFP
jgi:ABC-2 type transport system ATP-binding protein